MYIAGPSVLPLPKGAASLSFSNRRVWRSGTDKDLLPLDFPFWVDVRDVARAHIAALERREATGKRYLVSWGATSYAEVSRVFDAPFVG